MRKICFPFNLRYRNHDINAGNLATKTSEVYIQNVISLNVELGVYKKIDIQLIAMYVMFNSRQFFTCFEKENSERQIPIRINLLI